VVEFSRSADLAPVTQAIGRNLEALAQGRA